MDRDRVENRDRFQIHREVRGLDPYDVTGPELSGWVERAWKRYGDNMKSGDKEAAYKLYSKIHTLSEIVGEVRMQRAREETSSGR